MTLAAFVFCTADFRQRRNCMPEKEAARAQPTQSVGPRRSCFLVSPSGARTRERHIHHLILTERRGGSAAGTPVAATVAAAICSDRCDDGRCRSARRLPVAVSAAATVFAAAFASFSQAQTNKGRRIAKRRVSRSRVNASAAVVPRSRQVGRRYSAIDHQCMAIDVGGGRRGQEKSRPCNLPRLGPALGRAALALALTHR